MRYFLAASALACIAAPTGAAVTLVADPGQTVEVRGPISFGALLFPMIYFSPDGALSVPFHVELKLTGSNCVSQYFNVPCVPLYDFLLYSADLTATGVQQTALINPQSYGFSGIGTFTLSNTGNARVAARLEVLSAPEPSTWSTMILGFGLIGFACRRRRAPVNPARNPYGRCRRSPAPCRTGSRRP